MGYKTGKKTEIIAFLTKNKSRSFTLGEICAAVTGDGSGKSTVYRLVSELTAAGVLRRLSDGHTRHCTYQYVGGASCRGHLHVKCKGCGRLFHLDAELSAELRERVLSAGGFTLDFGELLFGRCTDCEEARV